MSVTVVQEPHKFLRIAALVALLLLQLRTIALSQQLKCIECILEKFASRRSPRKDVAGSLGTRSEWRKNSASKSNTNKLKYSHSPIQPDDQLTVNDVSSVLTTNKLNFRRCMTSNTCIINIKYGLLACSRISVPRLCNL